MITSKLDEKWDHISSTFLQLFNSVPNKYGDTNKYGDIVKHYDEGYAPIFAEILEFIGYHFSDEDLNFYFCERPVAEVCAHIVEKLTDNRAKNFKDVPLDGIDFEHWCADALRKFGWQATVSKASGDQGVDILARREGISVAVQCKRYTKPVGNKAVQEAFSGKQHVQASHACVIATGGFTKSAKELASSTGVFLLDAELISDFSKEYGLQNTSDDNNL